LRILQAILAMSLAASFLLIWMSTQTNNAAYGQWIIPSELNQAYEQQQRQVGHFTTNIASSGNGGSSSTTSSCIDARDAGPQWVSGYKQAQHDFGSGTRQTNFPGVDYQLGYDQAWKDASNGINRTIC
jgi:hypothetical protein